MPETTNETKIVDFAKYCPRCKYWKEPETCDACEMCLNVGGTPDRVPINFKDPNEKEEKELYYETDPATGKVKVIYKKGVKLGRKNYKVTVTEKEVTV